MQVSKYYQITTPESRVHGEYEEQGAEFLNEKMDLQEVLMEIASGGYLAWSSSNPTSYDWLATTEPEENRDYFEKGIERYYTLHFKNVSLLEFQTIKNYVEYLLKK
jgi:hypothetical protein